MLASEYVKKINALIEEHGDVEVYTDAIGHFVTAQSPYIANRKILKARETRPERWSSYHSLEQKGEKVISI